MALPVIGFAGMTHLGLCSSVASATKGFGTICFDPDENRIAKIKIGQHEIFEPDFDRFSKAAVQQMQFVANPLALSACDLVYISSDVPTDNNGTMDLSGVRQLIDHVIPHLRCDAWLVILCQVPPGFTREIRNIFPRTVYQVETLVFGQAMKRALEPERYIVGLGSIPYELPKTLASFLDAFGCPVLPMMYESAELAKISINCFLAAAVSTTNCLAELAEEVGADWREISPALRLDRRIGPYAYLKPGLGLAGGNIERDLATVIAQSSEFGTQSVVIESFVQSSQHRKNWALRCLQENILSKIETPTIAILGLSYKEDTRSIKNSPAVALAKKLDGLPLRIFDPMVDPAILQQQNVYSAVSALDAIGGADAVAVMTPWAIFREIPVVEIENELKGDLIVDPTDHLSQFATGTTRLSRIIMGTGSRGIMAS